MYIQIAFKALSQESGAWSIRKTGNRLMVMRTLVLTKFCLRITVPQQSETFHSNSPGGVPPDVIAGRLEATLDRLADHGVLGLHLTRRQQTLLQELDQGGSININDE